MSSGAWSTGSAGCELSAVMAGFRLRILEGWVLLDRPAGIRMLASATLRGLAGHLLASHDRSAVERWFKPGDGGNTPPALVFQPVHHDAETAPAFPFRIITWDPGGDLVDALVQAFGRAPGWPYGEGGAAVTEIRMEPPGVLGFRGGDWDCGPVRIDLMSPLRLRRNSIWLNARTFSPLDLVCGMVRRLNRLSSEYGNGEMLDPDLWTNESRGIRAIEKRLRDVAPVRRSSTQRSPVSLAGVVGRMVASGVAPSVGDLLLSGQVFHLGKHTTEGCGWVNIRPV